MAVQPAEHYEATMPFVNQDQVNADLLPFSGVSDAGTWLDYYR